MSFFLLIGYTAILIYMLSPDPMRILFQTRDGRCVVLRGVGVVVIGYLLSISCQVAALVLFNTFGFPAIVSYFAYTLVYVVFWLLEAEAFHRLQYGFSIQKALLKKKSIVTWLSVSGIAAVVVLFYNAIGGMATKYVLVEHAPGLNRLILKLGNVLFSAHVPDILLAACYLFLYYRTMKIVIRTAEWG